WIRQFVPDDYADQLLGVESDDQRGSEYHGCTTNQHNQQCSGVSHHAHRNRRDFLWAEPVWQLHPECDHDDQLKLELHDQRDDLRAEREWKVLTAQSGRGVSKLHYPCLDEYSGLAGSGIV